MPLRSRSSPEKAYADPGRGQALPLAALEFESPSAAIIATRVPRLSRSTNLLVFLLTVSTLAAAGLIQIDKIVSGRGKLVAEEPNIVLRPFDQSIVESIYVRKGDIVRRGQVLARLNPTFSAADLTAMKDQVDLLSATAARLEAEIAGTIYIPDHGSPSDELLASTLNGRSSELYLSSSDGILGSAGARPGPEEAGMFYISSQGDPPAELKTSILNLRASAYDPSAGDTLLDWVVARIEPETAGTVDPPGPANPHAELQALIFNQRSMEYNAALETYDQTINQLEMQIAGDEAQAMYYRERARLAIRVEAARQTLQDRDAGSLLNTLIATDTRLNFQSLLAQAESDAAQASRQMAAQRAERESYIQSWSVRNLQDLADTRRSLVQAQQAYTKASLHNELVVLTAPRDAIVLSVANVSAGSVVTSAEPLIHLVPMDVPLSVEVDISGIDSGYVRAGDEVTIKFDTLPYLKHGMGHGVVRAISADSFNPEAMFQEGASSLPNRPSTLYYKGDISIDELMLHDTPPGFVLMPGMPVTADVKVGTRSVLGYFVARILPVAYESIREP